MKPAPLTPSEIARRAEIAARAANGALHQDEGPVDGHRERLVARVVETLLPERIEPEISPVDVWVMTNGERILDIGGHRLRLNEALAPPIARLLFPSIDQEGR